VGLGLAYVGPSQRIQRGAIVQNYTIEVDLIECQPGWGNEKVFSVNSFLDNRLPKTGGLDEAISTQTKNPVMTRFLFPSIDI
jgi:hypothetical protein